MIDMTTTRTTRNLTWHRIDNGDWTADGRYPNQWYELHRVRPHVWIAVFHDRDDESYEYAFAIDDYRTVRSIAQNHYEKTD